MLEPNDYRLEKIRRLDSWVHLALLAERDGYDPRDIDSYIDSAPTAEHITVESVESVYAVMEQAPAPDPVELSDLSAAAEYLETVINLGTQYITENTRLEQFEIDPGSPTTGSELVLSGLDGAQYNTVWNLILKYKEYYQNADTLEQRYKGMVAEYDGKIVELNRKITELESQIQQSDQLLESTIREQFERDAQSVNERDLLLNEIKYLKEEAEKLRVYRSLYEAGLPKNKNRYPILDQAERVRELIKNCKTPEDYNDNLNISIDSYIAPWKPVDADSKDYDHPKRILVFGTGEQPMNWYSGKLAQTVRQINFKNMLFCIQQNSFYGYDDLIASQNYLCWREDLYPTLESVNNYDKLLNYWCDRGGVIAIDYRDLNRDLSETIHDFADRADVIVYLDRKDKINWVFDTIVENPSVSDTAFFDRLNDAGERNSPNRNIVIKNKQQVSNACRIITNYTEIKNAWSSAYPGITIYFEDFSKSIDYNDTVATANFSVALPDWAGSAHDYISTVSEKYFKDSHSAVDREILAKLPLRYS